MVRWMLLIATVGCLILNHPLHAGPATTQATDDRAALQDEIKTDQDAVKSIEEELASHEKDATDAEALAKNPPATVADADKAAYIDARKNEEQMAQDAAKDARERLKEAKAALDDAQTRLKALGQK